LSKTDNHIGLKIVLLTLKNVFSQNSCTKDMANSQFGQTTAVWLYLWETHFY
jgi:hypothetical protein